MKVMRLYVWTWVVAEDDVVIAVDQVGQLKVANNDYNHRLDHDDDAIMITKMMSVTSGSSGMSSSKSSSPVISSSVRNIDECLSAMTMMMKMTRTNTVDDASICFHHGHPPINWNW